MKDIAINYLLLSISFCLFFLYLYECKKINNRIDNFKIYLNDNYIDKLQGKLNFYLELAGRGTIKTNILHLNNLTVDNLTINNGSKFFGDTHYFYSKNGGKLKIGSFDGMLGLLSEDNKDLYIKSDTNYVKVNINNNLIVKNAYKKI